MEKAQKCCSDAERWEQEEEEAGGQITKERRTCCFKKAQKVIVQARQALVGAGVRLKVQLDTSDTSCSAGNKRDSVSAPATRFRG